MVVKKKRKSGVSVDFGGVESGGGKPCRDGRWKAYPTSCELKESDAGNEYLAFKWKITSGPDKNALVYDNCSLQPQALWKLKTLLEEWGEEVPDGAMELDPDDLIGEDKEIVIEITNEKYRGKDQPRITGFGGEESEGEEEETEEEERKSSKTSSKGSKSSKKPSESSEESEAEEEEEEEEEESEEEEEDKKSKKSSLKKSTTSKIKEGSKVQFEDEDGKTVRGIVTEVEGDMVKIEDKKGEEWEVPLEDVSLA